MNDIEQAKALQNQSTATVRLFAAVRRWKDNQNDVQVMEYFSTVKDALKFIDKQRKDTRFTWEVGEYK